MRCIRKLTAVSETDGECEVALNTSVPFKVVDSEVMVIEITII